MSDNSVVSMSEFANTLLSTLEEMDEESPYGLRAYFKYVNQRDGYTRSKVKDETAITFGVAEKLFRRGMSAFAEVRYPDHVTRVIGSPGSRCDIVAHLGNDEFAWLEVKPYYAVWWDSDSIEESNKRKGSAKYISGLADDCTRKLSHLRQPQAAFVGALLVAFETESDRVDQRLVQRNVAKHVADWELGCQDESGSVWPSRLEGAPRELSFYTRCWFWWRESRR